MSPLLRRKAPEPEPEPSAPGPSAYSSTGSAAPAADPATTDPATTDPATTDPATTGPDAGVVAPSETAEPTDAPASAPATESAKPGKVAPKQTLAGRVWVFLAVAAVLLVLVIIFIAENTKSITISFLGAHGHISEALALLLAVVVGIVICLLVGTARILQLSLEVRRQKKAVRKLS